MKQRLYLGATMLVCIELIALALIALDARSATIAIDPAALSFTPAEKAALCGPVTSPTCPDPGTSPPPAPPPSTNPPGEWNGSCPGFDKTLVMTMNWQAPTRLYTKDFGRFGVNDALVVRFKTGSVPTSGSLPAINGSEYDSAPSDRLAVLSETPCDWTTKPGQYAQGNSFTVAFALKPGSGYGFYPQLELDRTYYVNIRNTAGPNCALSGVCDVFVFLNKPGNL